MSKDKAEGVASKLLDCVQQVSAADFLAMPLHQWGLLAATATAILAPIFGVGYGLGRNVAKNRISLLEREIRDLRNPDRPADLVVVDELKKARQNAEELATQLSLTTGRLTEYDRLRRALEGENNELWRFHSSTVPNDVLNAIHSSDMRVLVFANLRVRPALS